MLLTRLMEPKRLGLLRDLVPGVPLIGVLVNPSYPTAEHQLEDIEEAARRIDQGIVVAKARTDEELDAAFAALVKERVGALLVGADPYFDTRRDRHTAGSPEREPRPSPNWGGASRTPIDACEKEDGGLLLSITPAANFWQRRLSRLLAWPHSRALASTVHGGAL
jgi:hypothetical protein